jgi:hypothetical protein
MGSQEKIFGSSNTISKEEAIARTTLWRQVFAETFQVEDPAKIIRGFRIPIADIHDLADKYKDQEIEYVRAYLCAKPTAIPSPGQEYTFDIILVPVKSDEKDLLSVTKGGILESAIYDVTQPCPPCCDTSSPLYYSGPTHEDA